jgi:uncharacterized membrane protein
MKYDPDLNLRGEDPEPEAEVEPQLDPSSETNSNETSLGIEENVAGVLTYVAVWVTGIAFLLIEKENSFVRFHAMQSIVVFVPLTILSWIVGALPGIGGFLEFILWVLGVGLWLFLMLQAYQGKRYKLPFAGEFAESQLRNKGSR